MPSAAGFDWPGLMRAGIVGRGLTPREFWALTPAELMMMLGRGGAAAPLSRAGLNALAALYPDNDGGNCDGLDTD
ncbi:rcc01693 family protein [Oceaniglobus ichthyenteri]|uniref:rcc01693 family protein n=1 Tax=Oceaniglobus ichthyenteri TaxID=2136177 RepID=UPI003B832A8E